MSGVSARDIVTLDCPPRSCLSRQAMYSIALVTAEGQDEVSLPSVFQSILFAYAKVGLVRKLETILV